MKIVSFEVAKIIKEAGYPQDRQRYQYGYEGNLVDLVRDGGICYGPVAPTYLDVWLWLWREKKVYFGVNAEEYPHDGMCINDYEDRPYADPEEAIENAIMFLVKNDLIK